MSPDIERLIALQQVETAIADARAKLAAHPERLAAADATLESSRALVEAARARHKANQDARRDAEKDAAMYQGRLSKFKDQLSAVKTNREYQAMQHEIGTAQQDLGAAEEKVLERMMDADAIAAELQEAEAAAARHENEVAAEKKALDAERTEVERTLSEAVARRDSLLRETDAQLVSLFQQVARGRKGVAISLATRDGMCSACHVRLRPPVFQKVRHNDSIVQCEICQRILYYIPPPPPLVAPRVKKE
jgi:predicted  nucleic acid-binding Zn-ribbon protein